MLISIIIITYRRKEEILTCLKSVLSQDYDNFEIILVDNNTEGQFSDFIINHIKDISRLKYIKNNFNSSVTGGRNLGVSNASGEICVFIDDDAFFEGKDSLTLTSEKMSKEKEVAVLAYKIINYSSKKVERKEFPFKNKKIDENIETEASYFLGGAHAIRSKVFDLVGGYPKDFEYGMEELDISFRILDKGFRILYFPSVVAWHNPSTFGRLGKKSYWKNILGNRLKVGIRNLPWRYFMVNLIVWSLKALKESMNAMVLVETYSSLIRNRKEIFKERKVISHETLFRLKKIDNRLYY